MSVSAETPLPLFIFLLLCCVWDVSGHQWFWRKIVWCLLSVKYQSCPSTYLFSRTAHCTCWVYKQRRQILHTVPLTWHGDSVRLSASNRFPPFWLSGGTLAHAFLPRRGEAHFDRAERWTLNGHKGHNLFMVTAHEIGHTLGLEHSPVRHALMSPYYRKLGRSLVLSWDDIIAVQQLYGEMMICLILQVLFVDLLCLVQLPTATQGKCFLSLHEVRRSVKGSTFPEHTDIFTTFS